MVHIQRQEQIDVPADLADGVPGGRYDITPKLFEDLFVRPWAELIKMAMRKKGLDVENIDFQSAEAIDRAGAVHPDQILGAFSDQADWIQVPGEMSVLNNVPNAVFDVRLSTGEMVSVALTGMNVSGDPDASGFVVLKKAA